MTIRLPLMVEAYTCSMRTRTHWCARSAILRQRTMMFLDIRLPFQVIMFWSGPMATALGGPAQAALTFSIYPREHCYEHFTILLQTTMTSSANLLPSLGI